MKIYISGISGTGMGPLAIMAKEAGLEVCGSDAAAGAVLPELKKHQIPLAIGPQTGDFLTEQHEATPIDWFVYTSALSKDHPELLLAQQLGLKVSKRDELIDFLVQKLDLKMVAIAGTHGKTTTTSMIVWLCLQLGIPVSYLIGTTLPFAGSGAYDPKAKFFIYEADEYDRNFLHFHPWLSLITTVSFDHPDIYKDPTDYRAAFDQFESQSTTVVKDLASDPKITLAGAARRADATLALAALKHIRSELSGESTPVISAKDYETINNFPGVGRRFEKIAPHVFSDYGHHPEEVAATVAMALEEAKNQSLKGVVILYEPHQNTRQHEVQSGYRDAFQGAEKVFWLPTFLTREDPSLPVLSPADLIKNLANPEIAEPAEPNDTLAKQLHQFANDGYLVLLMSAGPADRWLRQEFSA